MSYYLHKRGDAAINASFPLQIYFMTSIEKLLVKLIKITSFSGSEGKIGNFIVSQLRGFKIRKQIFDRSLFDINAIRGNSRKWLVFHMDTVAVNIPLKIDSRNIF